MPIPAEQVVIELVEPESRSDLEASCQAARDRFTLEEHDIVTALCQPVCHGQAQGPGSQDGGRHGLRIQTPQALMAG